MELTVRELAPWDSSAALLIDGRSQPSTRPAVHLQAASGGYLRLVGPNGPVLWGLVDSGWYGVDIVRSKNSTLHVLPPIRVEEAEHAPEVTRSRAFRSWWTRHYAALLCASSSTPLALGRQYLLAASEAVPAASPGKGAPHLVVRRERFDELLEQRDEFVLDWDVGYVGLLLTRQLSDSSDGRVKMWRKRAREGKLPPLLTWWCEGLFAHVLLDGHDRVHAALLEGVEPDVIVLADASPQAKHDVDERQQRAVERAVTLETIPSVSNRASAMNAILRADWDPRAEWELATPGFALDGGVERWEEEVRDTSLAIALSKRKAAHEMSDGP